MFVLHATAKKKKSQQKLLLRPSTTLEPSSLCCSFFPFLPLSKEFAGTMNEPAHTDSVRDNGPRRTKDLAASYVIASRRGRDTEIGKEEHRGREREIPHPHTLCGRCCRVYQAVSH